MTERANDMRERAREWLRLNTNPQFTGAVRNVDSLTALLEAVRGEMLEREGPLREVLWAWLQVHNPTETTGNACHCTLCDRSRVALAADKEQKG